MIKKHFIFLLNVFISSLISKLIQTTSKLRRVNNKLIKSEINKIQGDNFTGKYSFSIVITTFEPRLLDYTIPLVENIRKVTNTPIICVLNGNYYRPNNFEIRKKFLKKIQEFNEIYTVMHPKFVGMSYMWNVGIQITQNERVLVLNDDIDVSNLLDFNYDLKKIEKIFENQDFFLINKSFSHFGITIKCLNNIGWFDERFLGFGEEDGDFYFRYLEFYKSKPFDAQCNGILHFSDQSHEIANQGDNKYSPLNRIALNLKYKFFEEKADNMFGVRAALNSINIQDYKMPSVRIETYDLLNEENNITIQSSIRKFFL